MENKRNLKEKGITLVALVITIIVLLILSGVIISTLVNGGILKKSQQATNEYQKQQATEIMKLKITNLQVSNYVEKQKELILQELADGLCEDKEIEYVLLESKKNASLEKIKVETSKSIYTKLKKYPYEFEIGDSLQIVSIDGRESSSDEKEKYTYIKTGLQCYLDSTAESTKKETVWEDLSEKNNNATLNGCTWTDSGLNFDGVDDWANLGYQDYGNFTLEIVFDTNTIRNKSIFGNWENGGYGIQINSNNQIVHGTYINGSYNIIKGETLKANTKYKITSTCNGKENKIYINGELVETSTITDGLIEMPDANTVMVIRRKSKEGSYY